MASLHDQISAAIARILEIAPRPGPIVRAETAEWDSLKHVDLIFAIEDEFAVQLSEEEMINASSSTAIASIIEAHRAA